MNNQALSTLLCAITTSIAEAQRRIEEEQLANFISYFKTKDGVKGLCPRTLKLALPSMRSGVSTNERDLYKIPLFAILPHNGLRIEKTEVDFAVTLNGLDEAPEQQPHLKMGGQADAASLDRLDVPEQFQNIEEQPVLRIDLNGNWGKSKGLSAKIKLTVSSVDLPEGTMRMIDEVGKTGQGYTLPDSLQEDVE